uniref:Uncharacterized protein n=1 Tax=Arundo donax TaxID=35708 RepID=A0A0A9BI55_ARUDO
MQLGKILYQYGTYYLLARLLFAPLQFLSMVGVFQVLGIFYRSRRCLLLG